MSKRIEIIDGIRSSTTTNLDAQSVIEYSNPPAEFSGNELITYNGIIGLIPSPIRLPFTAQTGLTINWQTDMPSGYTQTYYQLFGNYVEARAYFKLGGYSDPTYTVDGSDNVDVVTFDWGASQDGWVKF